MITLHSVSKEVGRGRLRKLVLDNITWTIPPRGRYVILGHKGCGKSTLLDIISGLKVPTSGWVERRGSICPGRNLVRAFNARTPRQIASRLAKTYGVATNEIVDFTTRFAKLDEAMNIPVKSLPNAMRQRFTYALIYAIPFDFYLLDEQIGPPNGDIADACRAAFDARCKSAGAILATSRPRFAEQFEGTGGILYNGKVELFNTVREAIAAFNALPHPESVPSFVGPIDAADDAEDGWI